MLRIQDLAVRFTTEDGPVDAVHDVSLSLAPGDYPQGETARA